MAEANGIVREAHAPALVHVAAPVHQGDLEGGAVGAGLHGVDARLHRDLLGIRLCQGKRLSPGRP
jgi:hypothetical protein